LEALVRETILLSLVAVVIGATLGGCQTTGFAISPVAVSGMTLRLVHVGELHEDCTPSGEVVVRILKTADHGAVASRAGEGYTNYPQSNPRNQCNYKPTPGVNVFYTSPPGYMGSDSVVLDVFYPGGTERQYTFNVNVK
jgi:hypothetical protein